MRLHCHKAKNVWRTLHAVIQHVNAGTRPRRRLLNWLFIIAQPEHVCDCAECSAFRESAREPVKLYPDHPWVPYKYQRKDRERYLRQQQQQQQTTKEQQ